MFKAIQRSSTTKFTGTYICIVQSNNTVDLDVQKTNYDDPIN